MANLFESRVVLPFGSAEHRFLQVLVTRFSLSESGDGFCLQVEFDNKTPAIWSDRGKREVRQQIAEFETKSKVYQEELDAVLLRRERLEYAFHDERFPFRYGSGGTLPIIRRDGKDYYCFFYRDVEPIGWNIANGGCDSLHELLDPIATVERELREELVAFNPQRQEWLLYQAPEGGLPEQPEFLAIRRLMAKQLPHLDLDHFTTTEIPLKWLHGPDRLRVRFGESTSSQVKGCFLNINAEDFGIELDRIAWITIPADAVLCEGEPLGGFVVNSPVGLFEIDRFNQCVAAGQRRFVPDVFFYDGRPYDTGAEDIEVVLEGQFIPRISSKRSEAAVAAFRSAARKLDMCPVTRRIVQRYLSTLGERPTDQFDVFISFASEDHDIAKRVYDYLIGHAFERVFFSTATLHDGNWSRQIDQALESARRLILVSTSVGNVMKPNVEYEWRAFEHLMRRGDQERTLVPVMLGVDPQTLPLCLRLFQGYFPKHPDELTSILPRLVQHGLAR